MTNREIVQKINQDTQTSMKRSAAYDLLVGSLRFDSSDGKSQDVVIKLHRLDDLGLNGEMRSQYDVTFGFGPCTVELGGGAVSVKSMRHLAEVFTLIADIVDGTQRDTSTHGETKCRIMTMVNVVDEDDINGGKLIRREHTTYHFNKKYGREPTEKELANHVIDRDGNIERAYCYAATMDQLQEVLLGNKSVSVIPNYKVVHESDSYAINHDPFSLAQKVFLLIQAAGCGVEELYSMTELGLAELSAEQRYTLWHDIMAARSDFEESRSGHNPAWMA